MEIPERLLKKKCQCGEHLKFYTLVGIPFIPEMVGVNIYKEQAKLDTLRIFPGVIANKTLFGLAFTGTCSNCGNISAWQLTHEEVTYLLSGERDLSYGIGWIYNHQFLDEQFKNFPDKSFYNSVLEISKRIDMANNSVTTNKGAASD
ncbi:MAG: hypothetical protein FD177_248 [Desulfovibrionaceae bacterium]|nr:MAG: hypothetical protein FD177_248 [Desulfovibrionaceae bacterium]